MLKLISTVALAATLAAGAAQAQPPATATDRTDTYSLSVHVADLNLATPSGLATFRGRVRAAAAQACGDPTAVPLFEAMDIVQCRAGFIRSAEGRLAMALNRQDTVVAGTR